MTDASQTMIAKKPPLWILIVLAAVSPLAINLFVPSMPSIVDDLQAPYTTVQLGLSLYLFFTAPVSLISGPLSDRFGRKPVLLVAFGIFLIGSLMCVFATSDSVFLAGRIIQTASAAGMILSRAIVRDVYPREKSASMIGYVVMGMAIAPMIGPAIGGYIDGLVGWRWSFGVLGIFGAVALVAVWLKLPETNPVLGQNATQQVKSYKVLLSMPLFWLYTATAGLTSAVFFGFLGGGPAVSSNFFAQTPFQYGMYFSLCAIGYAIGNGLSGRYSESAGIERMMTIGAFLGFAGPIASLGLFLVFDEPAAWMLFVPLSLVGLGNGMTLPNVTAAAISLKPEAAGAASGLLGALQIGIGAIASLAGGFVVGESGSPTSLCVLLAGIAVVALVITLLAARKSREQQ